MIRLHEIIIAFTRCVEGRGLIIIFNMIKYYIRLDDKILDITGK